MEKVLHYIGWFFTGFGVLYTVIGSKAMQSGAEAGLIFLLVGLLFLAMGLGFVISVKLRKKQCTRLREQGRRISAEILEIYVDYRVRFNRRHPWVIRCQAVNPADGQLYLFKSEGLWADPAPKLQGRTHIPVYVNPENWKQHTVDADLLKLD